jgi:hypothetical protein
MQRAPVSAGLTLDDSTSNKTAAEVVPLRQPQDTQRHKQRVLSSIL